jgi:hypothetical protein
VVYLANQKSSSQGSRLAKKPTVYDTVVECMSISVNTLVYVVGTYEMSVVLKSEVIVTG